MHYNTLLYLNGFGKSNFFQFDFANTSCVQNNRLRRDVQVYSDAFPMVQIPLQIRFVSSKRGYLKLFEFFVFNTHTHKPFFYAKILLELYGNLNCFPTSIVLLYDVDCCRVRFQTYSTVKSQDTRRDTREKKILNFVGNNFFSF